VLSERIAAQLDRDAAANLGEQVYDVIRQLILAAVLAPGQRLPSSRQLAADLAVARNTVIDAYAQLSDEGYVESRVGAGSFVATTLPETRLLALPVDAASGQTPLAAPMQTLSRRARAVLAETTILDNGVFAPCEPDVSHFPFQLWQRLLSKAWRQVRSSDARYAGPGGHPALREAIAEHVQIARQVRCTARQVVIVNGAQQGLAMCAMLLADAGDRAWVEDPGYPGARRVFRAADMELVPVGVDAEGMAPRAEQWRAPPRLLYITPSHQFPTGVVMSLRRRRELLDAAARHGSWIIEDDYDGEFRFSGRPIASLQGIDNAQRVIYLGTFSKALFPGLRLGYLVLPESICDQFSLASAQLAFEGRQVEQAALAAFMREGHFSAHIRRMRMIYAARRELLALVWREALGESAPLTGADTGIHLVAQLPEGLDVVVSEQARVLGMAAQALSSFYAGAPGSSGLVIGYGGVHEQDIRRHGKALAQLVRKNLSS
jgi:GntR family transcriptional regulator/MocR family aminotransferase